MNYKCNRPDCGTTFHEHDQTNSQHKHGICPYCGVDDIREVTTNILLRWMIFLRDLWKDMAHPHP